MEKHIVDSFNDSFIKKASEFYEFDVNTVEELGGFENLMFSYMKDDVKHVLRITHKDHQLYEHILAELEFINYLFDNGANVVTPIASVNGLLAEKLEEDGFMASCFLFAKGRHVKREDISPDFYREYGKSVALLHKLTTDFEPEFRRYSWDEDILYTTATKYLPKEQMGLVDQTLLLFDRINKYPKMEESYGLIHTDMHMGNFFVHGENELTIFDFDDSAYKWFISDIAIVVFYQIWLDPKNTEKVDYLMTHFMEGYNEVYQLDDSWFERFDEFLKLRRLTMCLVIHRSFDMSNPPEFVTKFFELHLEDTLNDRPMLTMDFTKYNKAA